MQDLAGMFAATLEHAKTMKRAKGSRVFYHQLDFDLCEDVFWMTPSSSSHAALDTKQNARQQCIFLKTSCSPHSGIIHKSSKQWRHCTLIDAAVIVKTKRASILCQHKLPFSKERSQNQHVDDKETLPPWSLDGVHTLEGRATQWQMGLDDYDIKTHNCQAARHAKIWLVQLLHLC